jgi:hypothetical protein
MKSTTTIFTLIELETPENFSFRNSKFDELTDHYFLQDNEKIFLSVIQLSESIFLNGFGNAVNVGKLQFSVLGHYKTTAKAIFKNGHQVRKTNFAGQIEANTNYSINN